MSLNHIHECPNCGNKIDESEMHEGRVTCDECYAELYFDFATNELKEVPKHDAAPEQDSSSYQAESKVSLSFDDFFDKDETQSKETTKDSDVKQPESAETKPSGKRYYVHCDDSQTDTYLDDPEAKYDKASNTFFCKGCKKIHTIDGFFFSIQEKVESSGENSSVLDKSKNIASLTNEAQSAVDVKVMKSNMSGDHVSLTCDTMNGMKITVPQEGGIIGRYGTISPDFFQNFPKISGEHCRIYKNEYGKWMLQHLSHTNDTEYDGILMNHEKPSVLSDGKKITLARFLTFTVHIY